MKVSGMADQRVHGYGFGKRGKIAHEVFTPVRHEMSLSGLSRRLSPGRGRPACACGHTTDGRILLRYRREPARKVRGFDPIAAFARNLAEQNVRQLR